MSMSNSMRSTTAVDDQFILHPDDAKSEAPISTLKAHAVPMMWRPIATAPKDGSWILAWRGSTDLAHHNPMVIAKLNDCEWVWPDSPYDVWTEIGRRHAEQLIEAGEMFGVHEDSDESFTHWMPLPEPPAVFDEGEHA